MHQSIKALEQLRMTGSPVKMTQAPFLSGHDLQQTTDFLNT